MSALAIHGALVTHIDIKITVFGGSQVLQVTEVVFGKTCRMNWTGTAADHFELLIEEDIVDKGFRPLRVTGIIAVQTVQERAEWCGDLGDRIELAGRGTVGYTYNELGREPIR